LLAEIISGNALLGLIAAGLWGVGDYSGGMGVKAGGGSVGAALRVVVLSHGTSLSVLLAIALLRGDGFPHGAALRWGLAAGVAGGLSLCAFYVALSRGGMGASSAISGVLAAAIPAVVASFAEGSPGWRKAVGFVVAGAAIWLIAAGDSEQEERSTRWLAIGAGAGFGLYFVALKFAGSAGVIWPMATARMGSISTCLLVLLALRRRPGDLAIAAMLASALAFTACFVIISFACDYRYLYALDLSVMAALFHLALGLGTLRPATGRRGEGLGGAMSLAMTAFSFGRKRKSS